MASSTEILSQTHLKGITVLEYICLYGPVILLLCMTTTRTGLYPILLVENLLG